RTIGGMDTVDGTLLASGPTTGLVISADGYIISSAFNFAQQPASILVTFASGKQVPADLVATDHSRMLVLLKATGVSDLPVPTMAPLHEIRPGQWAIAVGRTFSAKNTNVTVGIVSALGRMFGKVIQTDADVSLANYGGPLIDIRGRVLGVIVPMAPRGASEVAGTEWYDSGIGFAVPLGGRSDRIERMKKGQDQRPGLLGIGLEPGNPHAATAELAVVRPDSPAGQAGLKKGDRIVELNGKPIKTENDLQFSLGTAYSGDVVRLVAMRGKERIERTITLTGELPAFRHAFLGILPMRPTPEAKTSGDNSKAADEEKLSGDETTKPKEAESDVKETDQNKKAVIVRMVYDGSPAADAGIQSGDRIVDINGSKIRSIDNAISAMNNVAPGNKVNVRLIRGGQSMERTLSAVRLPTNIPSELPSAYDASVTHSDSKNNAPPAGETRSLKLPEFRNKCSVYVPAAHESGRPRAVLLWLRSASESKPDDVIRAWRPFCDRDNVLLVVPSPAEGDHWERPELEYLRRLSERLFVQYQIDAHRTVVCGEGNGGAIAWLVALSSRDLFRGAASLAAPLPRLIRVPQNEPTQRLQVLTALPASKVAAAPIMLGLHKLDDEGYNVTTMTTTSATGQFSNEERRQFARWIDTLDRF
ncbi:MAG TPA: PDZ domain-containing protein, partial [Lacipirellulaceae bacterium]|nr:PDZ domain-containing protein [Lacipirellulaceae bacterium]